MNGKKGISRREFFRKLLPGRDLDEDEEESFPDDVVGENVIAVIQGRYCLAYQEVSCTRCSDHCPVPGAIEIQDGYPMVISDVCTGCRVCKDVCPSAADAILMIDSPC